QGFAVGGKGNRQDLLLGLQKLAEQLAGTGIPQLDRTGHGADGQSFAIRRKGQRGGVAGKVELPEFLASGYIPQPDRVVVPRGGGEELAIRRESELVGPEWMALPFVGLLPRGEVPESNLPTRGEGLTIRRDDQGASPAALRRQLAEGLSRGGVP